MITIKIGDVIRGRGKEQISFNIRGEPVYQDEQGSIQDIRMIPTGNIIKVSTDFLGRLRSIPGDFSFTSERLYLKDILSEEHSILECY